MQETLADMQTAADAGKHVCLCTGRRDDYFEEDGEIISRETIETSIDGGEAYRIMQDGKPVGYAAWCVTEGYIIRTGRNE